MPASQNAMTACSVTQTEAQCVRTGCTERLARLAWEPSVDSKGDSYDRGG